MSKDKERLDILLVKRGFYESRRRAQGAIMAGLVLVAGEKIDKAGTRINVEAPLRILGDDTPYVSRGGLKLAKALRDFGINLDGKVVLDGGASTGGFTDCALKHGAKKVYAVDVGRGQLAWPLRQDPRVFVWERTNIRYLKPEHLPERADFACLDLSFISLEKVLPAVSELLVPRGEVVALVKPQFEAGPEKVGRGGVVRDPAVHREVLHRVAFAFRQQGLGILGLSFSPLSGAKGNREYLLYGKKGVSGREGPLDEVIANTVAAAWEKVK